MIKTKLLVDGYLSCETRLDEKINLFIIDKRVIDIQYAPIYQDNRASALIIYTDEEVVTDGKWKKGL